MMSMKRKVKAILICDSDRCPKTTRVVVTKRLGDQSQIQCGSCGKDLKETSTKIEGMY